MTDTKEKLKKIEIRKKKLEEKLRQERAEKTIQCKSCGEDHRIKDVVCIQDHWYESPHGCTGGDNWWPGELQFICPAKNERNRLLFTVTSVNSPEKKRQDKFRSLYKNLFKSVENLYETYEGKDKRPWTNNYYVSENPGKFDLDE